MFKLLGEIFTSYWKNCLINPSLWPHGLRHELSSPTQALRSWVRILLEVLMSVYVSFVFVLSSAGIGLASG
jgi:hypothetical protein